MRCVAYLLLLWAVGSTASACSLTATQRQAAMYQAVQMLSPPGAAGKATKGTFKVRADHYYNDNAARYVPVRKIYVHEYNNWGVDQTEWNMGRSDQIELRMTNAEVGKYYEVRVEWEDGKVANTEAQMQQGGTSVSVTDPD